MIAHRRESDGKEQPWDEHSHHVAELCARAAEELRLGSAARLLGLLHDFGKGSEDFQRYLRGIGSRHPSHAGLGALYVYRQWRDGEKEQLKSQTAQLLSLCIYGHHAGLPNCLSVSGDSPYLDGLRGQSEADYRQAEKNFYAEVASKESLDALFLEACRELREFGLGRCSFSWGMLARLMLSILVDADRWDAACFEYDADPYKARQEGLPDWEMLLGRLESYLEQFPKEGKLAVIRRDISDRCRAAGEYGLGSYTLSVPTGGGKTYSSLRFALAHAKKNKQRRIFYIIPMNTILDQNARDIREALSEYPSILEYHSNVISDEETEEENSRRLTERFDSDIILTSLVQFLDSFFRKENGKVRRMYRFANSVLIFDEVQALPKKCRRLFRLSLRFLVRFCGCTVLRCTATQPELGDEAEELIPNVETLYRKLKRVRYLPQTEIRGVQEAAEDITGCFEERGSVLTIVNTKDAAWNIFQEVSARLEALQYRQAAVRPGLTDEELDRSAGECGEDEILCVHLSTLLCPMHRKEILRWMKSWLARKKPVCCISTALIEAGINISFPTVIRSMAGIPSLIQAAGRCNRNGEAELGKVYLWNLAEEGLRCLPDIQKGREISMSLLGNMQNPDDLGNPEEIKKYFAKEEIYTREVENYPYREWNADLVGMLSGNPVCRSAAANVREEKNPLPGLSKRFCQSFRTVGTEFQVIEQKTRSVLVPYGKGRELIEKAGNRHTLREEIRFLKEAQQYSVNLFEHVFARLAREGALVSMEETGAVILKDEYYDTDAGVRITPQEMKELIV